MTLKELINQKNITIYELSKKTHIPLTTLYDLTSGKSCLKNCKAITLYNLSKYLKISMEELLWLDVEENISTLPKYLQLAIKNFLKAKKENATTVGDYWMDINSSINIAEVDNEISHDLANVLSNRYLW